MHTVNFDDSGEIKDDVFDAAMDLDGKELPQVEEDTRPVGEISVTLSPQVVSISNVALERSTASLISSGAGGLRHHLRRHSRKYIIGSSVLGVIVAAIVILMIIIGIASVIASILLYFYYMNECFVDVTNNSTLSALMGKYRFGTNGEYRIAFVGDQGNSQHTKDVWKSIKNMEPDIVVGLGDFDYIDDPGVYFETMDANLGKDVPFIAAVGNHDVAKWKGFDGYQCRIARRMHDLGVFEHCLGEVGIDQLCIFGGIPLVLSQLRVFGGDGSVDTEKITQHLADLDTAETIDANGQNGLQFPLRFCAWHFNMADLQPETKGDQADINAYEACRKHNALVFNGHAHAYGRTKLMSDFVNLKQDNIDYTVTNGSQCCLPSSLSQQGSSKCSPQRCDTMKMQRGESLVVVQGNGGLSLRDLGTASKASYYAASDNTHYAFTLCTFRGQSEALCHNVDEAGNTWDAYKIVASNAL